MVRQKRNVLGMFIKLRRAAGPQGRRKLGLGSKEDGLSPRWVREHGTAGKFLLSSEQSPHSGEHGLHGTLSL